MQKENYFTILDKAVAFAGTHQLMYGVRAADIHK